MGEEEPVLNTHRNPQKKTNRMSAIIDALTKLDTYSYPVWKHPAIKEYILTGDPAKLASIPAGQYHGSWTLESALPDFDAWTDEAERVLNFAIARGVDQIPQYWIRRPALRSNPKWDLMEPAVQRLRQLGIKDDRIRWWLKDLSLVQDDGTPNVAGSLVLKGSDAELKKALEDSGGTDLVMLLAHADPARLERLLDAGTRPCYGVTAYRNMLRCNTARFHERAWKACEKLERGEAKILLLTFLAEAMPERYLAHCVDEARAVLRQSDEQDHLNQLCSTVLLMHRDAEALPLILNWMANSKQTNRWNTWSVSAQREMVLKQAVEKKPEFVLPMAEACTRNPVGAAALLGLKYWKAQGIGDTADRYHEALRRLLANADASTVVSGIAECRDWDLARTQEDLWPLLQHKSRPVRSAAARALAGLGFETASSRAAKLLEHKKADVRQAAVTLLGTMGGETAMRTLKQRLDAEENDDVRDSILMALESNGGGAALSPDELTARIAKTLAKAGSSPVPWIDPVVLSLKRRDGAALSRDEVRYLLIRQSRCKEMRADLEAKPLYASLDRAACGASALAVLQAFLGTGQDAADRWVFAFAALTGDDRIVPVLSRAITDWADKQRGKLAEYAAQALALLGTESALMVVDSLSVRYRSKNKNIGQAAAEAFAEAAERRGVTIEELGDLVVPWLGFEPGKPRLISAGKTTVEARISDDFKIVFRDTTSGKVLAKLPASAGAEIQSEFKALTATLKEAVKAQLLRIETLLVRQFRWPVARWRELYLSHPLLKPFTQRLVWSWRGDDGVIAKTFRALDDSSLTDVQDNAVELPANGTISIVHPLELDEKDRQAWVQHLADYNIAPPFPQLDRPAVTVKEDERAAKHGKLVEGTSLNAMTFRSRAEKLGWTRGSVVDNGAVSSYKKIFSGAGIDAFLDLDGMYMGIGVDETIQLGKICFVKSGSVQTGSYTYDEPGENDPRLIAFGNVPTVPFSEVMGDLVKISGKTADAPAEAA
jgi:hypothetical protein